MGVHMDEGEMASLEPQLQKIFKKQLGFFDDEVLSSTLKLINKVMFPLLFLSFLPKSDPSTECSSNLADPHRVDAGIGVKKKNYTMCRAQIDTVPNIFDSSCCLYCTFLSERWDPQY